MMRAIASVLVCALFAVACSDEDEATEVIIEIDAEAAVKRDTVALSLQIASRDDETAATSDRHSNSDFKWPFKLALTPKNGDAMREYRVTVEALDENAETIAAARIVSGFVAGERRRVLLVIEDACIEQGVCNEPEQTCHRPEGADDDERGVCTDAWVDPKRLGRGETPKLGDLLEAPAPDAGSPDAAADGAVADAGMDDAGVDGGPPDPCGASHGGCDPLSTCTRMAAEPMCGACPTGYAGDGESGCAPRLLDLTVTPGELMPAFSAETFGYNLDLTLPTESIVTASAPVGATLSIDGGAVTPGNTWMSEVLAVGPSTLAIEVVATASDLRMPYTLAVTRGAQEAYLKANNTGQGDHFGIAVATSGNTLVIGAESEDGMAEVPADSGAAYVFVRDGTGWRQQAYLKADNAGPADGFGQAVAISGDTIVVGAPAEDSSANVIGGNGALNDATDAGAVYVFVREDEAWSQQAYIKADNADNFDFFGGSVAIAGDTIAVGAPLESSNATVVNGDGANDFAGASGAAYAFVRTGTAWSQQAYLKPLNNAANHQFGTSVAVGRDGEAIAVGAPGARDKDELGRGSAYVFTRDGTTWTQLPEVKAGASTPGETFGYSVAMAQNTLVVGTNIDSTAAPPSPSGAAYVFDGTDGFASPLKLTANNPDPGDNFGYSVAIDGNLLLVGAPFEAGSAIGVRAQADRGDNDAPASGAAYVFARSGVAWPQLAYLKASNAESSDRFGIAVGVSDGKLVVGAQHESSSATGVTAAAADEPDNGASSSGAAYVFQ